MKSQLIISVGREFGSAGHEIAEQLAKHYGIDLLDHNLLDEIAMEKQVDADSLKHHDEKLKNKLFHRTVRGFSSSPEENVSLLQFEYLRKKADKGDSFVVVGRCSESVLKEYDCMISIFVLGDRATKRKRVMEIYGLNEAMADRFMTEKDMKRKRYHNSYCEGKWGDSRNYGLSINSSTLGVEKTVKLLVDYIDMMRECKKGK